MATNGSLALQEKETYRIGEVAVLTHIEPHVLRYWEMEFPALHPVKTPSGQRLYRARDVETVLTIKRLLYEEGFTIAGARRRLEAENGRGVHPRPLPMPTGVAATPREGSARREQLRSIRAELQRLLTLLSRQ